MKVKIAFLKPDPNLGAVIRALAVQVEGYKKIAGQTNRAVMFEEAFFFEFRNAKQAELFERMLKTYIASEFQNSFQIQKFPPPIRYLLPKK
jgi:hypothetical protein